MDGILGHNLLLSQAFFGGNPFMDGILGFHGAFFTNSSFLTIEFWLLGSLSHEFFLFRWNLSYHKALFTNCSFSRWNLGYHEALFTNFSFSRWNFGYLEALFMSFSFSRWNFGYHEALFTNFSFTMEILLSRSLSHELFFLSRWNSGYQGAFHTNYFFFHDGILAIKEPCTQTLFSFTMELWLSRSLSHELFFLSRWNSQNTRFGGRLFSYISQRVFT
jgi:hypothetical protein